MGRPRHYQTGADSCACGEVWPCSKDRERIASAKPSKKPKTSFAKTVREVQAATMPDYVTDHHRKVADAKVGCAIEHLNKARASLDAACRDLCSVIGANRPYGSIAKLSREVHALRRDLDLDIGIRRVDYAFDRVEVKHEDLTAPYVHGCGIKPRRTVVAEVLTKHGVGMLGDGVVSSPVGDLIRDLLEALEANHA